MIKIYDSKLKKKVEFKPLKKGQVGMYVCGPTVYDVGHLGHGRSAVCFDIIRRYFEYSGNKVNFVFNYTDIDDKIINRAKEKNITTEELVKQVIPAYEEDYKALGILAPTVRPLATENINEMIDLIKKLEKGGYTYTLSDGVYFDISKFKDYGQLAGQNLDELKAGARVAVDENKKNSYDFVLWKFKKEGEPSWKSPWGEGRPGWHIECSAMSRKFLGEKFDIHGGGLDLKFPHHECENAQSQAAFGKGTFAQYWMHNGFITVNKEKMSKSLGNFFTLKEIFAKYDPKIVRFMFLQTHYRNPIDFSDSLLGQSKAGLNRLHDFVRKLENASGKEKIDTKVMIDKSRIAFEKAMNDDFDTSGALGAIFELVKEVNSLENLSKKESEKVLKYLKTIDEILGVIFVKQETLNEGVEALIKAREEARKNKDFKKADELRNQLKEKGIDVEDTANGTIWKKISH